MIRAQVSDSDVTGDIASAVAAALTAIDEDSGTVSTQQRGVLLTAADGAVLRMRIGRHGTETGRLIVACESPSDARDVPGAEALRARATADPARPAARIAADLHRRMVEPYRAARPAAREWRRAADARTAGLVPGAVRRGLQDAMTTRVGVLRNAEGLAGVTAYLDDLAATPADLVDLDAWETTNLLTIASAVADAATVREETRGSHWREDFPERDDPTWAGHLDVRMRDGATSVVFAPAPPSDGPSDGSSDGADDGSSEVLP